VKQCRTTVPAFGPDGLSEVDCVATAPQIQKPLRKPRPDPDDQSETARVGPSVRTLWRGFWDTLPCQFRALPGARSAMW
jgi:hypothetical protein